MNFFFCCGLRKFYIFLSCEEFKSECLLFRKCFVREKSNLRKLEVEVNLFFGNFILV